MRPSHFRFFRNLNTEKDTQNDKYLRMKRVVHKHVEFVVETLMCQCGMTRNVEEAPLRPPPLPKIYYERPGSHHEKHSLLNDMSKPLTWINIWSTQMNRCIML